MNSILYILLQLLFISTALPQSDYDLKECIAIALDNKKTTPKKSTLKPIDDEFNKLDAKKILEQEDQEFDRFPSLAKIKRAREKEKLQAQDQSEETKFSREVSVPDIITVQDLANRMAEKTADVVKSLMKMGVMANATQSLDADTAELVVTELGHKSIRVTDDDLLKDIEVLINQLRLK